MSRYRSYAAVVAALTASAGQSFGSSRYRTARVLRCIHRNPQAHRKILGKLVRKQQEHEVAEAKRKAKARLTWDRAPLGKGGLKRKMRKVVGPWLATASR